jgi:DNA-damage-inducible protein D
VSSTTPAVPPDGVSGSPFDAIRHEDEYGEHWLGREMQPLMGYREWTPFLHVVGRAMRAAENTDTYTHQAFGEIWDADPRVDAEPADYRLSRYAAYLVAMNGDPNKPQVAEAQAYFAQRTRAAEVGVAKPMTELELAERYVLALRREQLMKAELDVARPKAGKWDRFVNADGLISMSGLANALGTHVTAMTNWLVEVRIFRKQVSGESRRNLPRQGWQRSGDFVVRMEEKNGRVFEIAYATPKGADLVIDLWERRTAA